MKRILSGLLAAFIASAAFAADVKISAEPAMSALAGTEIFLGNQSGVTKTATAAQISTYVSGSLSSIALASLAAQATNTVVGNATSGSAAPTALAVGTCSTSASALIWTTNTGFGCNTTINAGTLGGATFAAPAAIGTGTPAAGTFVALNASGLITGTAGATISGASINLNNSSTFIVNIGTGTNATTTTIGNTTAGNIVNLASVNTRFGGVIYESSTAPTINSHFNTSGDSIVASSTAAFQITVGSGTGTTTGSLTMPAAITGWSCEATDVTTPASHAIQQTGSSTTGVTVTDYIRTTGIAQNFANGDKINFICGAF